MKDIKPENGVMDLDSLLHKCKNRIYRIGIELEGGWTKLPPDTHVIRDGSVNLENIASLSPAKEERLQELARIINTGTNTSEQAREFERLMLEQRKLMPRHIGEIPSMPLIADPRQKSEVLYWENWIRQFFPSHFNSTCGLHIHMGFRTVLTYQQLMRESYQETVIEYLKRWAEKEGIEKTNPLWDRLAGKSEYCQKKFYADAQAQQKTKDYDKKRYGHRYTFIHYPFARNSTVECRGLPMFELERSIRAIKELLAITNAFLVASARKEEKFKIELQQEDDHFREDMVAGV